MRQFNKIFCIGLNKTGTTSLHEALKILGLRSLSWAPEGLPDMARRHEAARELVQRLRENRRAGIPMLNGYEKYDAYSDIGPLLQNFPTLDEEYPGSLFIFTDREDDAWIESRRKHVLRNQRAAATGEYQSSFQVIDAAAWLKTKHRHRDRVNDYFSERNDLLRLHICEGDGFEKLCEFLDCNTPRQRFPQRNRRSV